MEAKEKAIELFQDFSEACQPYENTKQQVIDISLRFVDAIVKTDDTREYWQEVKRELEDL